jgi:hypothetical protein
MNIPQAAKWGVVSTLTMNTCTGWWAATGVLDANKYPGTASDKAMRKLESYVVGKHAADDYGIWNNYGTMAGLWKWLYGTDKGVSRIKPNVPAAEWTKLNSSSGLFALYEAGDLGGIKEFCRMVAYRDGELAKAIGDPLELVLDAWKMEDPDNPGEMIPIREPFIHSDSTEYWNNGYTWHHGNAHTGVLLNIGYNTHPQNHCWGPNFVGNVTALPGTMPEEIAEEMFVKLGYGPGMGQSVRYATPMNVYKARAAKFAQIRKELTDGMGLCSWMYPFLTSPLRERGYRGDGTLECQYFNAATGSNFTPMEFEAEGERFFTLQRALTVRAFESQDMRNLHDMPQAGKRNLEESAGDGRTYEQLYENWDTPVTGTLSLFYSEMGYDDLTGAPTRATLERLDMKDVADGLAAAGLLPG